MTETEKTTAEIIQSAVNFKEEFKKPSKPRKQKQDPNAPYVRPKLIMPNDHKKLLLHT